MSGTEPDNPIEPAEPAESGDDAHRAQRPDWLMGADEGASRAEERAPSLKPGSPGRPPSLGDRPPARLTLTPRPAALASAPEPPAPASPPEPSTGTPAPASGPVAWKAAASSVPRLREQPAVSAPPDDAESFPGFAQDRLIERSVAHAGAAGTGPEVGPSPGSSPDDTTPIGRDPGFLIDMLERMRFIRHPIALAACGVLVCGTVVASIFIRHDPTGVSLAQIRQQPEAFEGRPVLVAGRAGRAYSVGESYVFDLCQGRDTVVVYSRTRRPELHEDLRVRGTVSIGYLDGAPRVAVFENTSTP